MGFTPELEVAIARARAELTRSHHDLVRRGLISSDEAHVSAVAVQITSVSDAAGDPIDGCGASDYVLLGVVMPVERTIEPGGSATFGGGAIGFADKPINQDACMLATVHLLYTVNP